jgi:hypothetical protein
MIALPSISCLAQEEPPPPDIKYEPPEIKVDPASRARIHFESDMYDFGSIPRGSTVVHTFTLRNTGEDTLALQPPRPTCGCTTAPLSKDKIAPGEQASIKALFNSQKFNGRVKKDIYISSNDPINPYLKISFTATINDPLLPVILSPTEADFGSVKAGESRAIKVAVTNNDSSAHSINISEQSVPAAFKASLNSAVVKPQGSAELVLELAPDVKVGDFKESVTLVISGGQESRFTVPLKAVITQ